MSTSRVEFIKNTEFVEFRCTGEFILDDFLELGKQVRKEIDNKPTVKKVLVDVSSATVRIDIMHRFILGEFIASNLPDLIIAIVANQNIIDKMVEDTAVNRGASVYVTHERELAEKWLNK